MDSAIDILGESSSGEKLLMILKKYKITRKIKGLDKGMGLVGPHLGL